MVHGLHNRRNCIEESIERLRITDLDSKLTEDKDKTENQTPEADNGMKVKQKSRTQPRLMNQRDKFGYSFWNSFGLRKAPFFFF